MYTSPCTFIRASEGGKLSYYNGSVPLDNLVPEKDFVKMSNGTVLNWDRLKNLFPTMYSSVSTSMQISGIVGFTTYCLIFLFMGITNKLIAMPKDGGSILKKFTMKMRSIGQTWSVSRRGRVDTER